MTCGGARVLVARAAISVAIDRPARHVHRQPQSQAVIAGAGEAPPFAASVGLLRRFSPAMPPKASAAQRRPHGAVALRRPDHRMLNAPCLVVGTRDIERHAMLVDGESCKFWI